MTCLEIPSPRNPQFVDRPNITHWLRDKTSQPGSRAALVAPAGYGKTQIVIEHAHNVKQESPETCIFWVDSSSESCFEEAYHRIAERVKIPRRDDPRFNLLQRVHDWLCDEANGPWLMVLDGANDVEVFFPRWSGYAANRHVLGSYLPALGRGSIIVTARPSGMEHMLIGIDAIYDVPVMEEIQAIQLLRNTLGGHLTKQPEIVIRLPKALSYQPLAVVQAGSYLKHRESHTATSTTGNLFSIYAYVGGLQEGRGRSKTPFKEKTASLGRDYLSADPAATTLQTVLNRVRIKAPSIANEANWDLGQRYFPSHTVVKTWQVSFNWILKVNPSAADLLCFMSFFNPHCIPASLLSAYTNMDTEHNHRAVGEDVTILCECGLVMEVPESSYLKTHALVQFYTQAWLVHHGDTRRYRKKFLAALSTACLQDSKDSPKVEALVPHIDNICQVEPLDGEDSDILAWADLVTKVGLHLQSKARYKMAERLFGRAQGARTAILGSNHPDALISLGNLAVTHYHQGRYREAEELNKQAQHGAETVIGKEYPDMLTSVRSLAMDFSMQKRHEEAVLLLGQVRDAKQSSLDVGLVAVLCDLALVLRRQGRHSDAAQTFQQAQHTRESLLNRNKGVSRTCLEEKSHPRIVRNNHGRKHVAYNLYRIEDPEPSDRNPSKPLTSDHIISAARNKGDARRALRIAATLLSDPIFMSLLFAAISKGIGHKTFRNKLQDLFVDYTNDFRAERLCDDQDLVSFMGSFAIEIVDHLLAEAYQTYFEDVSMKACWKISRALEKHREETRSEGETPANLAGSTYTSRDTEAHDRVASSNDDGFSELPDERATILESVAYQTLRRRFYEFTFPSVRSRLLDLLTEWSHPSHEHRTLLYRYKLRNLAAELQHIPPQAIQFDKTKNSSRLRQVVSFWQRSIENWTGEKWEWWPIPVFLRNMASEICVRWKCSCGEERWAEVPEAFAERLGTIIHELASSIRNPTVPLPTFQPAYPTNNDIDNSSDQDSDSNQDFQGRWSDSTTLIDSWPWASSRMNKRDSAKHRVLLMVRRGSDYNLAQISTGGVNSAVFFNQLRGKYYSLRGAMRSWFSVWRYSHCDFYLCEKFDDGEFVPRRKDDFPSPINPDYEYQPKPMGSIPPVSEHEFHKRFYACRRRRPVLHWYHKCKRLGASSRDLLELFPKKKTQLEEAGDGREDFWGIYARESIHLGWVLLYNVLCLLPMLVFFGLWALSWDVDLQTASVPFSMMISMLSLFWSMFLSSLEFGSSRHGVGS